MKQVVITVDKEKAAAPIRGIRRFFRSVGEKFPVKVEVKQAPSASEGAVAAEEV